METGEFPSCVDHIDRNPYNNSLSNLRGVTRAQNAYNSKKGKNASSIYKGVSLRNENGKWRSYITVQNKMISLGTYSLEEDAARAYDLAIDKYKLNQCVM